MTIFASARRVALGLFASALLAGSAAAQTYDGDWEGVLNVPDGRKLRLELYVKTEAGTTLAVLDSLDQDISVPSTAVKTDGGEFQALYMTLAGELKGKLAADGQTLNGSWTQGASLPLKLTRMAAKPAN